MHEVIIDENRYPGLSAAGADMLRFLKEHPSAPIFRNQSGYRLFPAEVEALRKFEKEVLVAPVGWPRGEEPGWISDFVKKVYREVPHYRALGEAPKHLADIPTVSRSDFSPDISPFFPDSVSLDRVINFRTTGTTGQPLLIGSHPTVSARYFAFHKKALGRFGVELSHRAGQVGVVQIGHQKKCFTYVSVMPTMGEAGLVKLNLHPNDWRSPDDRAAYLDALAPEVFTGDPLSFCELARLHLTTRPRACISVGMALSPGLQELLESRLGCPVLDVYSMNESGPVAVRDPALGGHVLLQPELYVEILDRHRRPVPHGERGEITLTGGFNFCLPLLRYRTGDFASLNFFGNTPILKDLSGRPPVRFRLPDGSWVNNIDVTHALAPLAFGQFGFHQDAEGRIFLKLSTGDQTMKAEALAALEPLFGNQKIQVQDLIAEDKVVQYTSALSGADGVI